MRPADCPRCLDLQDEIAWLKSELGLNPEAQRLDILRSKLKISKQQAELALCLFESKKILTKNQLDERLTKIHCHDRVSKLVDVQVCKLRKIIGFDTIQTLWGSGYRLTDIGRAKVEAALSPQTTPSEPDAADAERVAENLRRARAA